jgi:ornithine decarboxylase
LQSAEKQGQAMKQRSDRSIDRRAGEFRAAVQPAGKDRLFADAAELAQQIDPEEPVFCFSAEALRGRIGEYLSAFPGEVTYAVKANPGEHIILTASACGLTTFDVASVHEMKGVRSVAPRAQFHYHNPIKSRQEIEEAYHAFNCRRFAADDLQEIYKIADTIGRSSGVEIAVRFRLPRLGGSSAHDFSSKFGATRPEAVELLKSVAALGFGPVLTFHPGSQCTDPIAYVRHITASAKIARRAGVKLAALNVGGGFPARYRDADVPPLPIFFSAIAETLHRDFPVDAPRLECEPGRGLVATCTSLLTRIKLVKHRRDEVFINDGIYGALMEIYQVSDIVPPARALRVGGDLSGPTRPWTIYGPTCDPLDKLPVKFELPIDLREDDFIEFGSIGAYGAATSTRFNGYGGAETYFVREVFSA